MNDNFEKKQQEEKEKQEAGKNTAHVAAKGAATYFGGAVGGRAYDALSRTKAGQRLENTAGKAISKTPGLGQINKKLNDTGAVDAADKAVDVVNGKKPKKGLSPKKNSSNKKTNKESANTPNALQNRQQASFMQGLQRHKKKKENNTDDSSSGDNQQESEENEDQSEQINENKSYNSIFHLSLKQKIIIISILVAVCLVCILLFILIGAIFSLFVPMTVPISSLNSNKIDNSVTYYDETQPEKLQEEINFNNALVGSKDGTIPGIIDEYHEKYGVNLDKYTIEGVLLYVYAIPRSLTNTDFNNEELINQLSENNSQIPFDFAKALQYLDTVASMMLEGDENYYYTNVEKNGPFYNKLIDSDFLTEYYADVLSQYETRQQLVDEIYIYIDLLRYSVEGNNNSSAVISDTTVIYLQTCDIIPYRFKFINDIKVYDNPLVNEGSEYPLYLSFTDYLKGLMMTEVGGYIHEEYKEGLKAMMVAASTFMIEDINAGFDLKSGEMYFPNGNCKQVSCDPNYGCSYVKRGRYGTSYSGYKRFSTGNHPPLTESQHEFLNGLLGEVFGEIMVKKGVTESTFSGSKDALSLHYYSNLSLCESSSCMGQVEAMADAKSGKSYKEILAKYYDSSKYDLINIKEGLYIQGAEFENGSYDGNVIFYDQGDYKNVTFCGRSNASIATSGCGVTASAIVASTLLGNRQYDPVYMMNLAYSYHECGAGISGTNAGFFQKFANKFNLEYQNASKSQGNLVVEALKTGKSMVIAHMGKGHFTNGGHYIVLSAINQEGKVYVHDPNNRGNKNKRGTGNGWYDLNMIASELKGSFHIITKR